MTGREKERKTYIYSINYNREYRAEILMNRTTKRMCKNEKKKRKKHITERSDK